MKCLFSFLLTLTIASFSAFAQTEKTATPPSEPFIYLFDGTLLKSGDYQVKTGLFADRFYYLNGKKIQKADIQFYQDDKGYFANLSERFDSVSRYEYFARRLEAGAFDIFYKIESTGSYLGSDGKMHGTSVKNFYYAKGFGKVKSLDYDELKEDLSVFPNANFPEQEKLILSQLEAGKKQGKKRGMRIVYGLGVFLVGGLIYSAGEKDELDESESYSKLSLAGLGISTVGLGGMISYFAMRKPEKSYIEALRTYNKTY